MLTSPPAVLLGVIPAFSGALASAAPVGISRSTLIGALILWMATTAITWAIAFRVTSATLQVKNENLSKKIDGLQPEIAGLTTAIGDLRTDRANCELRAAHTFATKEETGGLAVQISANHNRQMREIQSLAKSFRDSVGKVHGRVDGLLDRTGKIEATVGVKT